ncbi:MAG: hypothetical protein U0575_12415 [Phycisphaerales bacterium]
MTPLLFCGPLAATLLAADPALPPRIHDWNIRYEIPPFDVVPTPHPGWDLVATSPVYLALYAALLDANLPLGIMLQDGTAPWGGTSDPFALDTTMELVPKLDYVFFDIELNSPELNAIEVCNKLRFNPDPAFSQAWIGGYDYFPGPYDEAALSAFTAPRAFDSAFYLTTGMDVAMPPAYPYAEYKKHTDPQLWGDYLAPNVRSALFWAPIAKVMTAKNSLPVGHRLIPWMAPFIDTDQDDTVEPPPLEDRTTLLQHLRLRGIDSYLLLFSFLPDYPVDQYRMDLLAAWHALDFAFDGPGPVTLLNLTTDKLSGVQWSGVKHGPLTVVLVSNLGNRDTTFTLPGGPWPDGNEVAIPMGTHAMFISNARSEAPGGPDLNGDGLVDAADLGLLLGAWGPCPPSGACDGDLNSSGTIDAEDLGLLLSAFGN